MLDEIEKKKLFDFVSNKFKMTNFSDLTIGYCGDDVAYDYCSDVFSMCADEMMASNFQFGCSKLVLFFDEIEDYVIKIPFKGCYGIRWGEEEFGEYEDEEYVDTDNFCEYENAGYYTANANDWDYCETESYCYKEAVKIGMDKALAGTWLLGMYEDYPIYYSEKMTYRKSYSCPSKKSTEVANSMKNRCDLSTTALAMFIESFGTEFVNDFIQYLNDNNIDDLHSGNIMYDKDDNPRIVDYSGFEENV